MTDLQLVLHWPRLLPSMIIFKTMRKHHKSIRDGPVWWYLQCWWDNTRWRVKKHNATPVMQVSFTEGDLRRTVSLPVPETPHQNKSFGPTYSLRPFQEELVGVIKVHKEARGAHCKREFLHGLQWLISSFSSITELQYCRIESIVTCWKMDGAFCIKTGVSRWLTKCWPLGAWADVGCVSYISPGCPWRFCRWGWPAALGVDGSSGGVPSSGWYAQPYVCYIFTMLWQAF